MIDVTSYLVETLRNAGIVGGRFYPQAFPPEVETPFIVYNGPNITVESIQSGNSYYRIANFQLTIYAIYEEALRELKNILCLLQDRRENTPTLPRLDRVRVINTFIRYDPTSVLTLADVFIEIRYIGD